MAHSSAFDGPTLSQYSLNENQDVYERFETHEHWFINNLNDVIRAIVARIDINSNLVTYIQLLYLRIKIQFPELIWFTQFCMQ